MGAAAASADIVGLTVSTIQLQADFLMAISISTQQCHITGQQEGVKARSCVMLSDVICSVIVGLPLEASGA